MPNTYFNIDFDRLVSQLLPVRLRKPVMLAWLKALAKPVKDLYDRFVANRNLNLYYLQHNSQTVFLQAVLNDTFDPVGRGIYIVDGALADPLYVYLDAELQPIWLGLDSEGSGLPYPNPRWLRTSTEVSTAGYSFVVMVPLSVYYEIQRMRATIDKYRLPSKNNYGFGSY